MNALHVKYVTGRIGEKDMQCVIDATNIILEAEIDTASVKMEKKK